MITCPVCNNAAAVYVATAPNGKAMPLCGACRYGGAIIPDDTTYSYQEKRGDTMMPTPDYDEEFHNEWSALAYELIDTGTSRDNALDAAYDMIVPLLNFAAEWDKAVGQAREERAQ
jgi:hypothetical protein